MFMRACSEAVEGCLKYFEARRQRSKGRPCRLASLRSNVPRGSVQAFIPPSTVRFAPVMYEDSGPATNATIAAISSARP